MSAAVVSNPSATPSAPPEIDAVLSGIAIPPRPALLTELQMEMSGPDPDIGLIARLVGGDVALTAAVLRTVNSPFYALSRKAATMPEAISLLGLRQIGALVTGFVLRKSIGAEGASLTRFWDVTAKRSFALARLARGLRGVDLFACAQRAGFTVAAGPVGAAQARIGKPGEGAEDDQIEGEEEG